MADGDPITDRIGIMALIRRARINKGLSQSDAARLCGMNPVQWHLSENPKSLRHCRPATILRMAAAVGLVVEYVPESFDVTGTRPTPLNGFVRGRQGRKRTA